MARTKKAGKSRGGKKVYEISERHRRKPMEIARLEALERQEDQFLMDGYWVRAAPVDVKNRVHKRAYLVNGEAIKVWLGRGERGNWGCIHGKPQSICAECGGSGLCDKHSKLLYTCSKCADPRYFCTHKRRKYHCRECRGKSAADALEVTDTSGIPDRYKRPASEVKRLEALQRKGDSFRVGKYWVKVAPVDLKKRAHKHAYLVDGKDIKVWLVSDSKTRVGCWGCIHGKRVNTCVDCGGSSVCEHSRRRAHCKECKGSRYCPHGRSLRNRCIICRPDTRCPHGINKYNCKRCQAARRAAKEASGKANHEYDDETDYDDETEVESFDDGF